MRRQDESKKSVILDFIDEYYNEYNEIPAVRTIAEGTGIALATVHRYLLSLKESGELEYNGRKSISTKRIDLESRHASAPVLGYVRCCEGEGDYIVIRKQNTASDGDYVVALYVFIPEPEEVEEMFQEHLRDRKDHIEVKTA